MTKSTTRNGVGTHILALVLTTTMAWAATPSAAEAKYDATWRFPEMTIPLLDKAPIADGNVETAEWAHAALFPPLLEMNPIDANGLPAPKRTWIWMGYTPDGIYTAFRQELPPEHLPLEVTVVNQRDACEGLDNTVVVFFWPPGGTEYQVSANAASQLYDRCPNDPRGIHWDGKLTYQSRLTPTGFEGELFFPFAELEVAGMPPDGTRWPCVLHSFWRKTETMLSAWPLVRWRHPSDRGTIIFGGRVPAVRFEQDGVVTVAGGDAEIQARLLFRGGLARQSYYDSLAGALRISQGEAATWQSMDQVVADALAPFAPAAAVKDPGEYLLRYDVTAADRVLARGVQPFRVAPPLDVAVTPYFLRAKQLLVQAASRLPNARWFEVSLPPLAVVGSTPFRGSRAQVQLPSRDLAEGSYTLTATAQDELTNVVARTSVPVVKPPAPDWWTMKEGFEPLVPPPWTPVEASPHRVEVLGRVYEFGDQALPSRVRTRGADILAAPIELRTARPWDTSTLELVEAAEDAAVYRSVSRAGAFTLKVTTRVEFDGFMYVDLDLLGTETVDKLDLVIPFKREHAVLLQNYMKAGGPGDMVRGGGSHTNDASVYKRGGKRFVGRIPSDGLQTPPMLTTWIGTDKYGLEWSCESSRGWAMASPNQAMDVTCDGDRVVLTVHLVSKPIALVAAPPRHIRFGLVATPTKTVMPYLLKARFYDDYMPYLLPIQWGEYPAWHPPLKNAALIATNRLWVGTLQKLGIRPMVNGGWNISTQTPEWDTWGKEMVAEPLQNVSFSEAKQFAACWNSPFAEFTVNGFGHNARQIGFDGIRFDTVVPSYECSSLIHDCGWRDDDGNLWPSFSIFGQREAWKRLYRIFHGGVITNGCIQTPNAAGPIMAVHSFSDHHEIGEGYYMHAQTLKDGFPPDMVRANMSGEQYGLIAECNTKGNPLYLNQRNAALFVNGAAPRWMDFRAWKNGYEPQANPAISVWNAWDWVDRWSSTFLGWWENAEYVNVKAGTNMVLASFHFQQGRKILLTVANYELEPLPDVEVKLDLARFGLAAPLYGEDAITLEPVTIAADGTLKLGVLAERYRMVKISAEPPLYRDAVLGPNLLTNAPAEFTNSWTSGPMALDAHAAYILSAQLKIDRPMGAATATANSAGMYGGVINHFTSIQLKGEGIHGINATNKLTPCSVKGQPGVYLPYADTEHYRRGYLPQYWERTPGWLQLFVPVGTATNTAGGQFVVTITDPGEAVMKDVAVRKVK